MSPDPAPILSILRGAYTATTGAQPSYTYWNTPPADWEDYLDATFDALEAWFVAHPPAANVGTLTLTLRPWMSDGVLQEAVVVEQNANESVEDFLARAKRTFRDALDQHPPD